MTGIDLGCQVCNCHFVKIPERETQSNNHAIQTNQPNFSLPLWY